MNATRASTPADRIQTYPAKHTCGCLKAILVMETAEYRSAGEPRKPMTG